MSDLWGWLNGTAIRERVANLPEAEKHRLFATTFAPLPETDYQWFLSQAVKEFELTDKRTQELDSKADSLIGYLGAAEGVLSMATIYMVAAKNPLLLLVSTPAVLAFLVAIVFAIVSRSPALHPIFPPVEDFILEKPDGHFAQFAARVAATTQFARLALREKAKLVRRSYLSVVGGLLWFVIGALAYSVAKAF